MASSSCENIISYSYSCVWNVKNIDETASPKNDNKMTLEFKGNENIKYLTVHTSVEKSNLYLHCQIKHLKILASPMFVAAFYVMMNKKEIFRTLAITLKKTNTAHYNGNILYASLKEFKNNFFLLCGPNDYVTIICDLKIINGAEVELPMFAPIPAAKEEGNNVQHSEQLLKDKSFSDVELVTSQGQVLQAHRAVLAACSPVFSAMFKRELKKEKEILVEDVDFRTLQKLIHFIYTGKSPDLSADARDLLLAADKYDIGDLKKKCEDSIARQLTIDNAVKTLLFAKKYDAHNLKRNTHQFICYRIQEVMETVDFRSLGPSEINLLKEIFHEVVSKIKNFH